MEYARNSRKITIEKRGNYCQCDNCAKADKDTMVWVIKYNKTNYHNEEKDFITDKLYANERELWLCEECLNELKGELNK